MSADAIARLTSLIQSADSDPSALDRDAGDKLADEVGGEVALRWHMGVVKALMAAPPDPDAVREAYGELVDRYRDEFRLRLTLVLRHPLDQITSYDQRCGDDVPLSSTIDRVKSYLRFADRVRRRFPAALVNCVRLEDVVADYPAYVAAEARFFQTEFPSDLFVHTGSLRKWGVHKEATRLLRDAELRALAELHGGARIPTYRPNLT